MLSELSQRKTNTIWSHLHVESKKQNKQNETDSDIENKQGVIIGEKGGKLGKIGKGD